MPSLSELAQKIAALESALICTHISPDPDAIGSSCGLQRGLAALGIKATVYLTEQLPERIGALADGVPLIYQPPQERVSAVIVVDTASRSRVGPDVEQLLSLGEEVITIDHHESNPGWGTFNYIDSGAAATAEILYTLLNELKAPIDAATADLLYSGILDDTGSFCYSNVSTQCLQVAAALVAAGAVPERVANALYFSVPERVLKLRAAAMANLRLVFDGKVSVIRVTLDELSRCGARVEDTEGLVDIARSVAGTTAAVFYRELAGGGWKFSLRAKQGDIDMNKVASKFGGGGHRAAAGLTVRLPGPEAEQAVLKELALELGAAQ